MTTSAPLPRSAPEAVGVSSAAVGAFLDGIDAAGIELHSVMLLRHGSVLAEGWWAPYERDDLHLVYSISKTFTSSAVALAVAEGLLDVDDLVVSSFPHLDPTGLDPKVARMRVRHLLTMSTGHHADTLDRLRAAPGDDPVTSFLALVPEEEPGHWFTYNNGATLVLSAVVTAATGERLLDYLRPRLLDPLGIDLAHWQGDARLDLGFSGLHLQTEAVARLGQLYLQGGWWDGRQLLPSTWVREATRPQVDNPREPNVDWRQGYGYQVWMARHGAYRGDGAYGQLCLVLPEQDAVLATTAAVEDMQRLLDVCGQRCCPRSRSTRCRRTTGRARRCVSGSARCRCPWRRRPQVWPAAHRAPDPGDSSGHPTPRSGRWASPHAPEVAGRSRSTTARPPTTCRAVTGAGCATSSGSPPVRCSRPPLRLRGGATSSGSSWRCCTPHTAW